MSSAALEPNDAPSAANEQWSVAQLEKNGKPLVVRYRSERPQGVETAAFSFLLSATWAYQPDEFGLPADAEMERMDKFEDALAAALETSKTAYLMVILTGNGERDWLWYTTGEEAAMRQVNQALKGHKSYPIQFSVQKDRGWKAYSQFEKGSGASSSAGGLLGVFQQAFANLAGAFCGK